MKCKKACHVQGYTIHQIAAEIRLFFSWIHRGKAIWIAGTTDLIIPALPLASRPCTSALLYEWKSGKITDAMIRKVGLKIFDNKLGAACIQMMLYAYMAEHAYAITITRCVLVFFADNSTQEYEVTREPRSVVEGWLQRAAEACDTQRNFSLSLTSEDDAPSRGFSLCLNPPYIPKGRPTTNQAKSYVCMSYIYTRFSLSLSLTHTHTHSLSLSLSLSLPDHPPDNNVFTPS